MTNKIQMFERKKDKKKKDVSTNITVFKKRETNELAMIH